MPSAKEEVGRAKVVLCWGINDPCYINWRNGIRAWARTNNVAGKRAARNKLCGQLKTFGSRKRGCQHQGGDSYRGVILTWRRKQRFFFYFLFCYIQITLHPPNGTAGGPLVTWAWRKTRYKRNDKRNHHHITAWKTKTWGLLPKVETPTGKTITTPPQPSG